MPSLGDSAFIFVLALLLFGPKKLPELARQLGKLMGEFRRASNEFRMQMEDELRISEQADRQKEIAAIQAAAPVVPALDAGNTIAAPVDVDAMSYSTEHFPQTAAESIDDPLEQHPHMPPAQSTATPDPLPDPLSAPDPAPAPIATSGNLSMRAPKTGLPFSATMGRKPTQAATFGQSETTTAVAPLFDSIPHTPAAQETHTSALHPASQEASETPNHA